MAALLVFVAPVFPQDNPSPEPTTVLDYYLSLPARFFENYRVGETREQREAGISVRDLPNGFLQLGKPGAVESATIALFKLTSGGHLVAVESTLCTLKCEQSIHFLRYEKGEWIDETAKWLPRIDDRETRARVARETKAAKIVSQDNYAYQLIYRLPRYGTTIDVTENWTDKKIAELRWDGRLFKLQQTRRR